MTDPKGELFEKLSPYFIEKGHYVKAVNFLDMAHSDGWNCLYSLEKETQLARTAANTAFSSYEYRFWTRSWPWTVIAICSTNACNFFLLNNKSQRACAARRQERPRGRPPSAALPPEHPAKGHHGLFLKARENLWGNIAIGLGNRLAIFQNKLVDAITRNHDVDLLLPGQKPCAYFVIISAQDSAYRFLSSLFFSLAFPRLSDYARLHGENGRLPVLVNFCLDEYCNIGYMEGIADSLNSIRGFNMSCQVVVQSLSQWQDWMALSSFAA